MSDRGVVIACSIIEQAAMLLFVLCVMALAALLNTNR
jgi:hypothetical protein